MIAKLNGNNCHNVARFDDTGTWFLEFKTVRQIDQLIEELKEKRTSMIAQRQKEYDDKHQLTLKFS